MLRMVSENKIILCGKIDEFIEAIESLQKHYSTLKEAIDDLLKN